MIQSAQVRTGIAVMLAKQAAGLGGGHVDILVNNAGTYPFGPTREARRLAEFLMAVIGNHAGVTAIADRWTLLSQPRS